MLSFRKGKAAKGGETGMDDDGELTARSASIMQKINSSGALWKKKAESGDDDDDGELTARSPSIMQKMKQSGALSGTTKPTNLKCTVHRALGNRIGLELNKRNRICRIDEHTPAAKAGLLVMDMVLTVNGAKAEGELGDLIDKNATEIVFEVERPHKSQHKKIIAEDNAYERAVAVMAASAPEEKPVERKMAPKNAVQNASTQQMLAAGFAVKKAE